MAMLPIVERELRASARRSRTYWLRWAAGGAAVLLSSWTCLWTAQTQAPGATGKVLFTYLSILAFAYCLLVGPFLTADSISEEKRDGTLGLLFLTDLRSLDVVLGKWTATSLAGFYGLLALLPALGFPLLLGGVTPGEYGRTALAIVNAILLALTAGMWVSTLSRHQPKAILGSVLVILGLSGLLPGLAAVVMSGFFTRPLAGPLWVAFLSPAYTGYLATDAQYRAAPQSFWISLGLVHAMSWGFLACTCLLVPRLWRDNPEEKPVEHRWAYRLGYTTGWRRTFRRRLDRNPVFAVAARLRWPHWVFWGLVSLVAINVSWLTYGYRGNLSTYQFHQYFSHALVFTNRVWVSVMACWFFLEARRSGALELMLTSPMPVRTLMRGHWRALRRLFLGPVVVIAALHVVYVLESWRLSGANSGSAGLLLRMYLVAACSSLTNFITDVFALCWVGAWLTMSSRRPNFAILQTFAWVILIPWGVGYCLPNLQSLVPPGVMAYLASKPWWRELFGGILGGLPVLRTLGWGGKNLVFILWARHHLERHLRETAAGTYAGRHSRLGAWWRKRFRPGTPTAALPMNQCQQPTLNP